MELLEIIRRRRMTRRYDNSTPVHRDLVDRLIDAGLRAPSAGSSQGWHFLVLDEPAAVARYWRVTATSGSPDGWLTGMMSAPVLIVVYSDRSAYERRYAEADKRRYDKRNKPTTSRAAAPLAGDRPSAAEPGPSRHEPVYSLEQRWPVPYWDIDAGMAALLIQLAAVDAGLGCCWFAVPTERVAAVGAAFEVPSTMTPVGVISVGYPASGGTGSPNTRPRRPRTEVVSYGRYGDETAPGDAAAGGDAAQ